MNKRTVVAASVSVCLIPLCQAFSEPKSGNAHGRVVSAASQARRSEKQLKDLQGHLSKLTPDQINQLIEKLQAFNDADNDGVPDVLEPIAGRCDSDIDDDGVIDGDEYKNGTSPGGEAEVKGVIQTISVSNIVVNDTIFAIDSSTLFLSRKKVSLPPAEFAAGDCVEVEGISKSSVLTAVKIKEDNDCGSDDDDSHDDKGKGRDR